MWHSMLEGEGIILGRGKGEQLGANVGEFARGGGWACREGGAIGCRGRMGFWRLGLWLVGSPLIVMFAQSRGS